MDGGLDAMGCEPCWFVALREGGAQGKTSSHTRDDKGPAVSRDDLTFQWKRRVTAFPVRLQRQSPDANIAIQKDSFPGGEAVDVMAPHEL